MDIVCRKTKCKYNHNQSCLSRNLTIDKKLNCGQYEPMQKGSLQDISRDMMEVAPQITPFRRSKTVNIRCYANCIFNKDCECMANGVFINGQTELANKKIANIAQNDKKHSKTSKKQQKMIKNQCMIDDGLSKSCRNIDVDKLERQCIPTADFQEILNDCDSQYNNHDGEAKCFTFAPK